MASRTRPIGRTRVRQIAVVSLAAAAVGLAAVAVPADAAKRARLVIAPGKGDVTRTHRVLIRVRSSDLANALSVKLNGVQIGGDFDRARRGIRTLRASISHGLRPGRNVLRVRVRTRYSGTRRATVRFFDRRGRPFVGAGRDRRLVVGRRALLAGGLRKGRRSKLSWRIVRAPHRRTALNAVTGRTRAKARLTSRVGRTAGFRPRTPGRYLLELTHGRGRGAVVDRVAVDAVPPNPLVPIDTGVGNDPISIGAQTFPVRPELPHFIQVVVLDRKTLKVESHTGYPDDGQALLHDLSQLDDSKLVVVSVRIVNNRPFSDDLTNALKSIGVPDLGRQSPAVQRYAAIGVPGLKPGSADYTVTKHTGPFAGAPLQGYLTPDQYKNYGFVATARQEFTLGAQDTLGCRDACDVPLAGLRMTIRDPYTYDVLASRAYQTSGAAEAPENVRLMASDLRAASVDNPGAVVLIQTVSNPYNDEYLPPVSPTVDKDSMVLLADAVAAAGGTRNAFNRAVTVRGTAASHGHVYQLVGWLGAGEGQGVEAAAGVDGAGDAPVISGALRPGRNSQFRPTEAVESVEYSNALADLAMQPPTTRWPLDDNPGARAALSYIARKADTSLGPDPRGAYWTQDLKNTEGLIREVKDVPYPGDMQGGATLFSRDEFAVAKQQLVKELGWVGKVHDYITGLAQPYGTGRALVGWATIQDIADDITKAANPDPGKVGVNWLEIVDAILSLIPELGPEESAAKRGIQILGSIGEFGLQTYGATGEGGEPSDGTVEVEVNRLGAELINQANQSEQTLRALERVILSDPKKLNELGENAGCNPTNPDCPSQWAQLDDAETSANVYWGVARLGYLKLMPLGFRVYATVREGDFQSRHFVRPTAPDLKNYSCSTGYPWYYYPDLARSSESLLTELDPQNGDSGWDSFVFSRYSASDAHGAPPPKDLLDRLFNPLSPSGDPREGGLALTFTQFALPELLASPDHRNYWWVSEASERGRCRWVG